MTDAAQRVRLHKFLARSGVGSRRTCEEYIRQGRVTVDGRCVTEMGHTIDPFQAEVRFDGERVKTSEPVYFLAYKPEGVVCTTRDQFGRRSVIDLLPPPARHGTFTVGRLEEDTEGLILVTNDGVFADRVLKGPNALRQTYFIKVRGDLSAEDIKTLREGVWLSDGRTSPMWVKPLRLGKKVSTVLVTPSAYQHRVLRRAFSRLGVHVQKVVRTRLGHLGTDDLKKGAVRRLGPKDVQLLLNPAPEHVGQASLSTQSRQRSNAAREERGQRRDAARQRQRAAKERRYQEREQRHARTTAPARPTRKRAPRVEAPERPTRRDEGGSRPSRRIIGP